jgi:hypothetical protein
MIRKSVKVDVGTIERETEWKADTRDFRIWVNLTMRGDDLVSPKGINTQ